MSNRADGTARETKIDVADVVTPGPDNTALHVTDLSNGDGLAADRSNALDRAIQRQADLRFAIVVAVALVLPALIGMGVYIAMTAALRAG